MGGLLVKPRATGGRIHNITPASAGWRYVGFDVHRLRPGEVAEGGRDDRERLLVFVTGKGEVTADGRGLGELGSRMELFDWATNWSVYAPAGKPWRVEATTDLELAVCSAPGGPGRRVLVIGPDDIEPVTRGKGANARHVNPIMMEDREGADSLLVTEVLTPQGNWSSYPPHKHDTDDYPNETLLEETYYHRFNPKQGFGFQRVYTDDGTLDATVAFNDGDVVLVPRGYHPVGTPYGYDLYYLNVMAGPRRNWRFTNEGRHDWIFRRDED